MLNAYNSTKPDLRAEIAAARKNPLEVGNLHTRFRLASSGVEMADPEPAYQPLVEYLELDVEARDLGTEYDYAPDLLSFTLYGTHDLWPLLLQLNRAPSRADFRGPVFRVLKAGAVGRILDVVKTSKRRVERSGVPEVGDLTLRPVYG